MANTRRLTFEVPEELHSRLKSEAAQQGISLGSLCTSILGGEASASSPVEKADLSVIAYYSLDQLRSLCGELIQTQPNGWKKDLANVNAEMRRRFKT